MGLNTELSALSNMCEEIADEIGIEARNLRVEWISKNRREIAAALEDLAKSRWGKIPQNLGFPTRMREPRKSEIPPRQIPKSTII